ncbi:SHOCT domain-containing protein [Chloroflexota bacterium]
MWFMHDFGVWGMLFGGIWILVFWGGLIALVWGIGRLTRHDDSTIKHTPLQIAKERYARGEIGEEQFEQIKKDMY